MKTIGIYDHNTGEQITREMTVEELAEYELGATARLDREAAAAILKEQQMTILTNLGLTEEQGIILGLIPKPIETIRNE